MVCSLCEPIKTDLNQLLPSEKPNNVMHILSKIMIEKGVRLVVNSCSRKHTKDEKHLNYNVISALYIRKLFNNIN